MLHDFIFVEKEVVPILIQGSLISWENGDLGSPYSYKNEGPGSPYSYKNGGPGSPFSHDTFTRNADVVKRRSKLIVLEHSFRSIIVKCQPGGVYGI